MIQERTFTRRSEFLPYNRACLGPEEEQEVLDTLRSGWLTTGPKTRRFEAEMATFTGAGHCVALNSCTAALHIAMVAAGIGEGDEILTPAMTFPSAINEMVHERITPVFVDVEPDTLNLDVSLVEERITPRTRAIMPVHFAGHPVEQDRLREIADRHGLLVIGDAAHATESTFRGRHVSRFEDMTAYSFYATKNLTTGEGGMLGIEDDRLAERARLLSLHGMSRDAWKRYSSEGYQHWDIVTPGYKYNLTDLASSLGLHQLRKLPGFLLERERQTARYDAAFADLKDLVQVLVRRPHVRSACHLYVIQVRTENLRATRDQVMHEIQAENVGIGIHFRAVHLHPFYRERFGFAPGMLPHTEKASEQVISIPLYPGLKEEDQEYVIQVVRQVLLRHRR